MSSNKAIKFFKLVGVKNLNAGYHDDFELKRTLSRLSQDYAEAIRPPPIAERRENSLLPVQRLTDLKKVLVIREAISSSDEDDYYSYVLGPLCTTAHDNILLNGVRYSSVQAYVNAKMDEFDNRINDLIASGSLIIRDGDQSIVNGGGSSRRNGSSTLNDFPMDSYIRKLKSKGKRTKKRNGKNTTVLEEEEEENDALVVDKNFIKMRKNEIRETAYHDAFTVKLTDRETYDNVAAALVCGNKFIDKVVHMRMNETETKGALRYRLPKVEVLSEETMQQFCINENALGKALTRLRSAIMRGDYSPKSSNYIIDNRIEELSVPPLIPVSEMNLSRAPLKARKERTTALSRSIDQFIKDARGPVKETSFVPETDYTSSSSSGLKRKHTSTHRQKGEPVVKLKRLRTPPPPPTTTAAEKEETPPSTSQNVLTKVSNWLSDTFGKG